MSKRTSCSRCEREFGTPQARAAHEHRCGTQSETCSECGKPRIARGYCSTHYRLWKIDNASYPCKIDGCDKPAGIPGTAKGYCSAHWDKYRKYGDPLHVERKRNRCTVDGCTTYAYGHGLCLKHYTRQVRHGSTDDPRPWVHLPDGQQWCGACRSVKPDREMVDLAHLRDVNRGICKRCARHRHKEWRDNNPDRVREQAQRRYWNDPEKHRAVARRWRENNPDRVRETNRRYKQQNPDKVRAWRNAGSRRWRARRAASTVVRFSSEQLEQRLSMFPGCWMCGDPEWSDVDHVKPLSVGGPHCLSNLRPACASCNRSKGAKWPLTT